MSMIERNEVEAAIERIGQHIHRTPVFTSHYLDNLFGAQVFFKAENLQKTGSFKARGATNSVLKLSRKDASNGVATHSSGNHGQALAWAAGQHNIPAYVVMPENAPKVKVEAVKGYAAEVIFCEPTLEARETTLESVLKKYGATFIPAYNATNTIEGQASVAWEIYNEIGSPDFLLTPLGGGGLLAGCSLCTHYFSPQTKVMGCEPAEADDALQSLRAGRIIPAGNPETIADGLRTSLGEVSFEYIKKYVDGILTASEENIVKAMQLIWERLKLVVEPSAAVPLACMMENKELVRGKKVAVILSGGNVDLQKLPF